jgi:hypothetical protein
LRAESDEGFQSSPIVPDFPSHSRAESGLTFSSTVDKIPPGPKLDALTAEKVFGWKNIQTQKRRVENGPAVD